MSRSGGENQISLAVTSYSRALHKAGLSETP